MGAIIVVTTYLCSFLLAVLFLSLLPTLISACRLLLWTIRVFKKKATFDPVVSAQVGPWPEPVSREELLGLSSSLDSHTAINKDKIIWGCWYQGGGKLPGICDMAVQSWRLRHPDWKIIIVSEDNYKNYVSHTDLPSTFDSLKIQVRTDIIRSAVLLRYGGVYMDISYVVLKAFDNLWEAAKQNEDIYLTSLWTLQSEGQDMVVPNICLIVAPKPHNPLLAAWHRSLLKYFESPSFTIHEMKKHPVLSRVSTLLDHPSLWKFKQMSPYLASLWAMCDTLYYESTVQDYVREHVYILPTLLWTVDQMMAPLFSLPEKDIYSMAIRDESLAVWTSRFPNCLKLNFGDDPAAASKFVSFANAVKASSDFSPKFNEPKEYHLSLQTTQGRIWRAALDKTAPMQQASTRGAYHIVPITTVDAKLVDSTPIPKLVLQREMTDPTVSMGDVELSCSTSCSDSSFSCRPDPTEIVV